MSYSTLCWEEEGAEQRPSRAAAAAAEAAAASVGRSLSRSLLYLLVAARKAARAARVAPRAGVQPWVGSIGPVGQLVGNEDEEARSPQRQLLQQAEAPDGRRWKVLEGVKRWWEAMEGDDPREASVGVPAMLGK